MFEIEFDHLQEFIRHTLTHICIAEEYKSNPVIQSIIQNPKIYTQFCIETMPLGWLVSRTEPHPFQMVVCSFRKGLESLDILRTFEYIWCTADISDRDTLFQTLEQIDYEIHIEYEREDKFLTEVFCSRRCEKVLLPKNIDKTKLDRIFQADVFSSDKFRPLSFHWTDQNSSDEEEKTIVLKITNPFLPT